MVWTIRTASCLRQSFRSVPPLLGDKSRIQKTKGITSSFLGIYRFKNPSALSRFIEVGICVIQSGNRDFPIYKHWHAVQPDFASVGPISCFKFKVTRLSPRNRAPPGCGRRLEAPRKHTTPAWSGRAGERRSSRPKPPIATGRFRPQSGNSRDQSG